MTGVAFRLSGDLLTGFTLSGHSGAGVAGEDVVCAAVSSAAYMTANTLTEVCGCGADIQVDEGFMSLGLTDADAARCQDLLLGFRLHMEQLTEQYPHHIKVTNLEV